MQSLPSGQYRKIVKHYSYALDKEIGHGLSSKVYLGRNDLTQTPVAIKVIQLASLRDQNSKNFLNSELKCISTLNHINVLHCIETYMTSNNCYIITEYCEGGDLQKHLEKKGKLNQAEIKQMFQQFYLGYMNLIKMGYIHRDIKPKNILIKKSVIKLADFGIVKHSSQSHKDLYSVGTASYMAPESLENEITTEKSDVWSIGIMLYQLAHGKLPFKGSSRSQVKQSIKKSHPIFATDLSKQFVDFVMLCLKKDPKERIDIRQMIAQKWMDSYSKEAIKINNITFSFDGAQAASNNIFRSTSQNNTLPNHLHRNPLSNQEDTCLYSQFDSFSNPSVLCYSPVSIITSYMVLIYKVFKKTNKTNMPNLNQFTYNDKKFILNNQLDIVLRSALLDELIYLLSIFYQIISTKQNILDLRNWEEFVDSQSWNQWVSFIKKKGEKWEKVSTSWKSKKSLSFGKTDFRSILEYTIKAIYLSVNLLQADPHKINLIQVSHSLLKLHKVQITASQHGLTGLEKEIMPNQICEISIDEHCWRAWWSQFVQTVNTFDSKAGQNKKERRWWTLWMC